MASPSLQKIQKEFWKCLTKESESKLSDFILGTRVLPKAQRLRIYSNAYAWRLRDVLKSDYPLLQKRLGDKVFQSLAYDYLRTYPSKHFSVNNFGSRLPAFIKQSKWSKRYPWTEDFAAYEWLKTELFYGPNHTVLTRDRLESIDPEKWPFLRFELIPNVRILKTSFEIDEKILTPEKLSKKGSLILWRKDEEIFFREIKSDELSLFRKAKAKQSFGVISDWFSTKYETEEAAKKLYSIFSRWLDDQIIMSVIN